jgi:adenosine deaminase CECR1
MRCFAASFILLSLSPAYCASPDERFADRFEDMKRTATPREMYAILFDLPKGGDLHHHGGLSAIADIWFDYAVKEKRNRFYTLTKFGNCPGDTDALPRFYTVQRATWEKLPGCLKGQYEAMNDLTAQQRAAWISALRIDQPGEGRNEFFELIVKRFGELSKDPYVAADVMVENMRQFGHEHVRYLEPQLVPTGYVDTHGKPVPPDEVARIYGERMSAPDAKATHVDIRFQDVIIRFLPNAEREVEAAYAFVDRHRDWWVGINMAGREDNEKGYPLRFLETYRKMRRIYSGIGLSIHSGEVDMPGRQVHDTLLLGATRIGHGLNLITDPDTMLLMRDRKALVEINLVSNRLLEYYPDLSGHPFPEYLRTGIPVCLNTDDRGSWDSNMTDEYFTAVTTFNLSWDEVVQLGRNSLEWAFADEELKKKMLVEYDADVLAFEAKYTRRNWRQELESVKPVVSGYAERTWGLRF